MIRQSSPDTGATVFTHDDAGNRVSRTDARGAVTEWDYDALGRVTATRYPANPAEDVAYTYDDPAPGRYGIGRLAGVADDSGSTSYRYDARGNLVREERVIEGAAYVTSYEYDSLDRPALMTYPSGRVIDYGYDSLSRVAGLAMRDGFLAPATILASGFGYEAFAGLNAMTHGNGVTLDLGYDLDGRLAALDAHNGATPVLDLDYSYDAASNIAAITDAGGGPRGQVFQYDALHRLTAASGTYNAGFAGPPPGIGNKPADRGPAQFPGQARAPIAQGDIAYSYDSVGNRTARLMDLGGATTAETYAYDAFSNRLLSVAAEGGRPNRATTRAISYGDSGNTEADGKDGRSLSYEYDQSDRLVGVSDGGVQTARYVHNAMGQRVVKDTGAGAVHYIYAGGNLIAEYDAATGAVIAEYVWLDGRPVAHVRDGATHWVHTDHLGTPQLLTDATGKIAWSAIYRPFGATAHVGGAVAFNLRFPGQYKDSETGLHYNMNRDYDPTTGRYIQSDPIGLGGGLNTYGYVAGNPVMFVDPFGEKINVAQSGNIVTISASITVYGPGASAKLAKDWENGIDQYWNNFGQFFTYNKCTLMFDIKVNADTTANYSWTASKADNYVYVSIDPSHRSMFYPGGNTGSWNINDTPQTAAHETGHIFSLWDDYSWFTGKVNKGHEKHLMAADKDPNSYVVQHEIDDIMSKIICQCR